MARERRITPHYEAAITTRGWEAVAGLAARRYGVVSLGELCALGVSPRTVGTWLERRRLVRLHEGVYAVGHAALTRHGRYLAAVLACGEQGTLSHRSAAALLGIRSTAASRIEVISPKRTGRTKPGLRVHGGVLLPDERTDVERIPCTTVARTLLDLAAVLAPRGVEAAVEASERLGLFDLREVGLLLGRHAGRRGVRRLRRAIAAFDEELVRVRSETEARFFRLCLDSGLPKPLVNRQLEACGEHFEVDFHWPAERLIVEVDSPFHDTTAARARDAHRDVMLQLLGWTVIRCRRSDIEDHSGRLVATLRPHLVDGPPITRAANYASL